MATVLTAEIKDSSIMAESLLGALANSYFSIDTTLYLLISYHILEKTYSGSHRSLNSLILYMGSNSIFSP